MPATNTNIDVAVIGAGIIGVCTALELVERGLRVAIFDPAAVCSETSYGNAGVISPWTCPTGVAWHLEVPSRMVNKAGWAGLNPTGLFTALPSLGVTVFRGGQS